MLRSVLVTRGQDFVCLFAGFGLSGQFPAAVSSGMASDSSRVQHPGRAIRFIDFGQSCSAGSKAMAFLSVTGPLRSLSGSVLSAGFGRSKVAPN